MPSTGEVFRYRSLSEREFASYEMDSLKETDEGLRTDETRLEDARQRLIVLCLCDGEGNRLLTDADVDAIGELDAGDTGALYDVLREHCGIAKRVREAQAKREAAKKNPNGAHAGTSPSGSPGDSA
jgi:hypothetical protein